MYIYRLRLAGNHFLSHPWLSCDVTIWWSPEYSYPHILTLSLVPTTFSTIFLPRPNASQSSFETLNVLGVARKDALFCVTAPTVLCQTQLPWTERPESHCIFLAEDENQIHIVKVFWNWCIILDGWVCTLDGWAKSFVCLCLSFGTAMQHYIYNTIRSEMCECMCHHERPSTWAQSFYLSDPTKKI